ncbi:MAG: glycosyltransferase family 4 protein [Candidatus Omnitrophica bacterium]|nr:glycosyltransferase family 4 protein [Candidatus Omnitrophota bacterium]
MRILMITEVFYPVIGGAGKFVYSTAVNLAKRGHDVSILTRRLRGLPTYEEIEGLEVHRIIWANNFITSFISSCSIHRFIKKFLESNLPDILVFNQPFSAFSAYFAREVRYTPSIYHFHSSWFEEFQVKKYIRDIRLDSFLNILRFIIFKPLSSIMRCIEGFVISHCDTIIVASKYSKDKLIRFYKIDVNKIHIIPGCVDIEKFKPAEDKTSLRNRLGIPRNRYILITVRNLVERMGIDNLILALYNLSKLYKDLYLIIVGSGRLKNKLVKMVKRLGISDLVKFTGSLKESELVQYYQASDLFILPTKYIEHFGLVTIEALASGIPVLGTPVGGTVEILTKFDKEFLLNGTDERLITQGIRNFRDKYKGADLKDKCREFAIKEYSLDKIIDQTEKIYSAIIEEWKTKSYQK